MPPGSRAGRRGGQGRVGEAGDLPDDAAVDGKDHDSVSGGPAPAEVADVGGHGRLHVGPGRDEGDLVQAAAGWDGGQELRDRFPAPVGQGEGRHGQQGVLAEQGDQGRDVAGVPGRQVAVENGPLYR